MMTESQELQYLRGKCSNLEQVVTDLRAEANDLKILNVIEWASVKRLHSELEQTREALKLLITQCEAENQVAGYIVINLGRAKSILDNTKEAE